MNEQITRRKLSNTRMAVTHKFKIGTTVKGYMTVGLFEDGTPGELFIHVDRSGSTIGGMLDAVAIITSMALQHGVPLEALVNKLAYQRFFPDGLTPNPDIRFAQSIIDYVFRWLGLTYVPEFKKKHTNPEAATPESQPVQPS